MKWFDCVNTILTVKSRRCCTPQLKRNDTVCIVGCITPKTLCSLFIYFFVVVQPTIQKHEPYFKIVLSPIRLI
jgi:hypothetical protein